MQSNLQSLGGYCSGKLYKGSVLPNTGTPPIPEQIVLKAEQIVYRFELPHSGLLTSF